jgi:hypothetical protein
MIEKRRIVVGRRQIGSPGQHFLGKGSHLLMAQGQEDDF